MEFELHHLTLKPNVEGEQFPLKKIVHFQQV